MIEAICQGCGTTFSAPARRDRVQKFCSRKCSAKITLSRPLAERFWEKVEKAGDDECWLWTGAITHGGYGVIGLGRDHLLRAHCLSYEMAYGAIPVGLIVRHKCDTPACVNPMHLEVGTKKQNMADMYERGRARPPKKLTDEQFRQMVTAPGTLRSVADQFGVTFGYVWMARKGQRRAG